MSTLQIISYKSLRTASVERLRLTLDAVNPMDVDTSGDYRISLNTASIKTELETDLAPNGGAVPPHSFACLPESTAAPTDEVR
jgi:hypothetical protein